MQAALACRNVHSALLNTVFSLLALLPGGSLPVYMSMCRGAVELATGLHSCHASALMLPIAQEDTHCARFPQISTRLSGF